MLSLNKSVALFYRSITQCGARNISIKGATTDQNMLNVIWCNEEKSQFPHLYLRDNCQCTLCFDAINKRRKILTTNMRNVSQVDALHLYENAVCLIWKDGHSSEFAGSWLHKRILTPQDDIKETSKPWSAHEIQNQLFEVDCKDLMNDTCSLHEFLQNLVKYGLCLVKGITTREGSIHQFMSRLAMNAMKKTHYGDIWSVKSKPSPNNLAYTSAALPVHVDLPFYEYQPEVQILHCIEQSAGESAGQSVFVDGLNAALTLKRREPEMYKILTETLFQFDDVGTDKHGSFRMQQERPIIELDPFGNVICISHNNHVRSSFINTPAENVKKTYAAYYALVKILYEEENVLRIKLKPGEMAMFNNRRVLHGRTAFDPTITTRFLEGSYTNWDEMISTLRTVEKQLTTY